MDGWSRVVAYLLLTTSAGATAVVIVGFQTLDPGGRALATVVAFGSFGALFLPGVGRYVLTPRVVCGVSAVLVAVAVLTPPRGSHDMWSYAVYGRLVSVHGVSPFTHVPADFPHDRLFHLVARGWRHTGSVYGPAFVAGSALGTVIAGASELATRMFFQLLEAAALACTVLLVWRRTRDPVAIGFLALNPALVIVVNGGHNDILVGLAVVAGTILLTEGHHRVGELVFAAGALIKLVLVLPVAALVLWMWQRGARRAAARVGVAAGLVVAAGYAVSGGSQALGPLLHASKQHSRSSLWQIATQWLAPPLGLDRSPLFRIEGDAAIVLVGLLVALVVVSATRHGTVRALSSLESGAIIAGSALLVFLLAGAFILPWYSAWALPVLGLVVRSRVAAIAAAQAALISVSYAAPLALGAAFGTYAQDAVPLILAGALVYLVWSATSGRLDLPIGVAPAAPAGLGPIGARTVTPR